jgi:hypothetical protein
MRKHGKQLPADRPEIWEPATSSERAAQRGWLNYVLSRMEAANGQRLFENICDSGRFVPSYNEAAVASILMGAFSRVEYEPTLNGQTPDLVVRSDEGTVRLIVEVANRLLPEAADASAKRWEQLRGRLQRCADPWLLRGIRMEGSNDAPTADAIRPMATLLGRWLSRADATQWDECRVGSFGFVIMQRLPGSHADLLIPHSELWSTSDRLVPTITDKVNKYAELCTDLGVPLVVVVAADPRSSVTVDTVRGAITGALTLSLKLDPFADGPASSGPVKLHQTDEVHRWHRCLSAVGWLQAGIDDPGTLTLFKHQYGAAAANLPIGGRIIAG